MATGSTIPRGNAQPPAGKLMEYEQFIDKQLRRTRSQVRIVDVASSLLVLATGTLAYFLVVALADHWLIAGGLPTWIRLIALGGYVAVAGWYFVTRLLPLFIRRINPLYAAETIERTQPSLKNGLLNFLMFRAKPQSLSTPVYQAVEAQAASNLARVQIETVVDRSKLLRIGYALAGVLAICALYKVLSPKDPITSVGRVVMPWADILPPTRVTIEKVQPGSSKAFRGQQVAISAEVRGLERDGKVTLFYTTADGQTVDRAVEMHVPSDGYRYICELPPDDGGIQQTVRYKIVAGDANSHEYTLSVVAAPTIVVDSVEYLYPDYTGLQAQKIEHQGDIKAIEGSRVVLHAVTNQPIKDGGVDLDCNGHEELRLTRDGTGDLARGATATFTLALEDDRVTPTHTSYQLQFRNTEGDQNLEPVRHHIDVIADLPPEIEFLAPEKDEVRMREGDSLPIELTASDPDFALKQVKLIAEVDGRRLFEMPLLKSSWRGQFNHKLRLSSREHSLKAGDVVQYWAVAEDVKSPNANLVETQKRRVEIVPRDAGGDRNNDGGADQPPMAGEPDQPPKDGHAEQGDQKDGEEQAGQPQSNEPQEGSGNNSQKQDGEQKGNSDKGQQDGDPQNGEKSDSGEKGETADDSQGDPQDKSQSKEPGDDQDKQSESGEQGGEGNKSDNSEKQPVANDGTEDGEAFDKALENLRKKQQEQPSGGGQNADDNAGQPPQDNPGSKQSDPQNKQTPGDKQGGEEKPSNKEPKPDGAEEDSSEGSSGNETKGMEQSSQSPKADAKRKPGESGGTTGQEQPGDAADDAKGGDNSQKSEPAEGVSKDTEKQPGDPGKDGRAEKTNQKPTGKGDPKDQKGEADSGNTRDQQPGEKSPQPGNGEQSKGDDRSPGKKPDDGQPRPDAKGGSSEEEKGESGAGKKDGNNQGAPEAQDANRQSDKQMKESGGKQDDENKTEAQSPSNSPKQSDSKGENEGDRSGGGKSGGGQKANQPGTGGAGKNTASDEGAGKSDERGTGETGENAGDQKESSQKTGQSGETAGEGSKSKPGDKSGEGNTKSQPQPGQEQSEGSEAEKPGEQPGGAHGESETQGQQTGSQSGKAGDRTPPPPGSGGEPGGEKANLEYAKKATDLALEHLRDQLDKGAPDQELLDELGWTRDDLEKFVRRWEQMRAATRDESVQGREAKRELDATLKSLGLRPRGTKLGGDRSATDAQRGLKETQRSSPPPKYADEYKAYLQGTARGGK